MTLDILVEGQSEAQFAWRLLVPHLQNYGIHSRVTIVGSAHAHKRSKRGKSGSHLGGGVFKTWKRDFERLLKRTSDNDYRLTTLFDLYGLPTDFPGLDEVEGQGGQKCEALERYLAETIQDWRLIPYLQLHEFEALVLAALPHLEAEFDAEDQLAGLKSLQAEIGGLDPELINEGRQTAPSKRLSKFIPGYSKTLHGPAALESAGLSAIREKCARFDAWLKTLEALGNP